MTTSVSVTIQQAISLSTEEADAACRELNKLYGWETGEIPLDTPEEAIDPILAEAHRRVRWAHLVSINVTILADGTMFFEVGPRG
jgi:hypothetical protein